MENKLAKTYQDLINVQRAGKRSVVMTSMKPTANDLNELDTEAIVLSDDALLKILENQPDHALHKLAWSSLETAEVICHQDAWTGLTLFEPIYPKPEIIIFGGGHISLSLAEFAAKVGFDVTLIDDRPYFANKTRFPFAKNVICDSYEHCFDHLTLNESTYVVIATRGHKHDMLCLRNLLQYRTAFIGMLGSRRRVKIVRDQLLADGFAQENIDRVQSPVGLEINAITPEEIAISIVSQLVFFKRQAHTKNRQLKSKASGLEYEQIVIEELAKESLEPYAIATIISAKGSVPRKAGAKMIVFLDGRTVGSVGGGCSEGFVIQESRYLMHSGGFKIVHVDMTGNDQEDDEMYCGGLIEVLIQAWPTAIR
jgi:xanthine dehydrogenase accessory factor